MSVVGFTNGCSGESDDDGSPAGSAGAGAQSGSSGTGGAGGAGGAGGSDADAASGGVDAGSDAPADGSIPSDADAAPDGADAAQDGSVGCNASCGSLELCDIVHTGLDDDCDGQADEGCPCEPGTAHPCFLGDPAYRGTPGCHDGTALCTEQGNWGACVGGVHATDQCFQGSSTDCHAIETLPFVTVALESGTGNFSLDAVSDSFSVTCPPGTAKCPEVKAPDAFQPLQSGQYTIKYTKTVQGGGSESCEYPLFVRAPGLRVELSWEHTQADSGVDLDLHLHEPATTTAWGFAASAVQDCNWSTCTAAQFAFGGSVPSWFADPPATPPSPVNWWLDSVPQNNTCYYAPQGLGGAWQSVGKGCHNPRLDLENASCDFAVMDPNNSAFCNPENINVDYPPTGKWMRIGVHYFSNHGLTYAVHPELKIFCDGGLAAHLGPQGYYSPEAAVTFAASDGAGPSGTRFWIAADVAFSSDACGKSYCAVRPIYAAPSARTPFFATDTTAALGFVPAYPAAL